MEATIDTTEVRRWGRYAEYRNVETVWLTEIPKHWEFKRLKWTIDDCQNGVWGDEPTGDDEEDIGCVRVADFDRDNLAVTGRIELTMRSLPKSKQEERRLKRGDLLLEKSGGGEQQPVGAVVLFDSDADAVCSNFVARVSVATEYCPSYLRYLHAGLYAARVNTRSMNQSTGIQNLDSDQYFDEKMGLPPFKEQQEIAAFLDHETARIESLIGHKKQLITLLEEKRQAAISHAVTRGLDPNVEMQDTGSDIVGFVPAHWNPMKLKYLFQFAKRQGFPDETVLSVYRDYGVIKKSTRDDNHNKTPLDLTSYQLVEPGDLVINKMKSWQGSLGISNLRGITSPDYVVYRSTNDEHLPYLHQLLRSRQMATYYHTISNGIRNDQWRLEPEKFEQTILFLPSKDEQKAIAEFIVETLKEAENVRSKIQEGVKHLSEYRTALISAAVTGQIDVREEVAASDG